MFKHGKQLAALALTALLCLPVVAYAADGDNQTVGVYDTDGYTVTIPAEVTLTESTNGSVGGTLNVSAELDLYRTLDISISSTNGWQLHYQKEDGTSDDTAPKLSYELTRTDGTALKEDTNSSPVKKTLQFKTDDKEDKNLSVGLSIGLTKPEDATMSGGYQDTLTFTMDCKRYKSLLTFEANASGDVTAPDSVYVTVGEEYGDALPTLGRDGYEFAGWYTAATDGDEVTKDMKAGAENAVVYAQWTPHILTIKYHNDGAEKIRWETSLEGKIPSESKGYTYTNGYLYVDPGVDVTLWQTETYGSTYTNGTSGLYNAERWSKTGATVTTGWWTIGENGTTRKDDGNHTYIVNAEDCAEFLGVLDDFKKGDVTVDLYPIWNIKTYTVTYKANADDVKGKTVNSELTYGEWESLTPNGYTRKGYTFTGWNTEADGTGDAYEDEQLVEDLTTAESEESGKVTLYAQWELDVTDDGSDDTDLLDPVDDVDDVDDEVTTPDDKTSKKTDTDKAEVSADTTKTESTASSATKKDTVTESKTETKAEAKAETKTEAKADTPTETSAKTETDTKTQK